MNVLYSFLGGGDVDKNKRGGEVIGGGKFFEGFAGRF
jgi:hypothetical protein